MLPLIAAAPERTGGHAISAFTTTLGLRSVGLTYPRWPIIILRGDMRSGFPILPKGLSSRVCRSQEPFRRQQSPAEENFSSGVVALGRKHAPRCQCSMFGFSVGGLEPELGKAY